MSLAERDQPTDTLTRCQTLLRFNLQTLNPIKPFVERCVGFFLHTDMTFRVTKRETADSMRRSGLMNGTNRPIEVAALPGAPEE